MCAVFFNCFITVIAIWLASTIGLEVLPVSERYAYILINDEKWWNRRLIQNRTGKSLHAFVRKGIVGPKKAEMVLFYITHPFREIRGYGEFVERVTGTVDELWNSHGHETVFESRKEYTEFLRGRTRATFIRFKNLEVLPQPIPMQVFSEILDIGRMPRSGKYISRESMNQLVQRELAKFEGV